MKKQNKGLISLIVMVALTIVLIFGSNSIYNVLTSLGQPKGDKVMNAGTYTATKQGFGGDITVEMTVSDTRIEEVKITGDKETPALGGVAVKELGPAMVSKQTYDVDAISGATVSSTAIKDAAKDCLTQANCNFDLLGKVSSVKMKAGTYTSTQKGFGGDVVVEMTVSETKIEEVKITGDKETPSLGGIAVKELGPKMVEKQTPHVDAVSGATVSSTAIITGAEDCLTQAGADIAAMDAAAQGGSETVEKKDETLDVDIVVVGAGGAGMTSAIVAKQQGYNVIILEKMPYVGGNTTKASGGMNAAGTKKQAAAIAEEKDAKVKESLEGSTVENFIKDTREGGHNLNDPELVKTLAENSSDAIDWLESIGAPLPEIAATGGTVHMYLHEPEDGSAVGEFLVEHYSAKLEEMGIQVYLNTEATEILMDNGKAVGVKAEGKEANYTINAKSVILATGGFGANEEMYCSYRPDLKGTVTTNAPGATGDGIVMAQNAADADLVDIDQIQLHPTVYQENGFLVSERLRSNGAILVNKEGKRFTNDLSTRDAVSAAELEQTDCCAYIVYDSTYADEALYQKYVTNGLPVKGDTLEDLAKEMGFDETATKNFVETVKKWNDTCKNNKEDEFGRNNGLIPMENGPYYAILIAPGIHHTMGGIKINTSAQVINKSGEVIPGLFAAGEVTGGVHGGNRIGGNAVADIVVYGRIAAQSAIDYMK